MKRYSRKRYILRQRAHAEDIAINATFIYELAVFTYTCTHTTATYAHTGTYTHNAYMPHTCTHTYHTYVHICIYHRNVHIKAHITYTCASTHILFIHIYTCIHNTCYIKGKKRNNKGW